MRSVHVRVTAAVLLLLLALTTLQVAEAAPHKDKHPSHPHPGTVEQCRAALLAQRKAAEARAFCLAYLQGRKPPASATLTSTVTPSATTTTTTQTTTTSTTQPDVLTTTTTTVITTSTATTTSQAIRRRGASKPTPLSQFGKSFPANVITDACFLYLYGALNSAATTTTVTAPAATNTNTAVSTSVVTVAPTTTSASTTTTTTTTITTTTSVAPSPTLQSPSFEECAIQQGPTTQCGWTFSQRAEVTAFDPHNAGGHRNARITHAGSGNGPQFSQVLPSLVAGVRYSISTYITVVAYQSDDTCAVTLAIQPTGGGASIASYSQTYTGGSLPTTYPQIGPVTFTAPGTPVTLVTSLHCTNPSGSAYSAFDLDDFSITVAQ